MAHIPGHEEINQEAIGSADLADAPEIQDIDPITPTNFNPLIDASLENIVSQFNQPSQEEQTQGDIQSLILESVETLGGERQRQQELEEEAGLGEQRQELQSVVGQLQTLQKESAAIPLQIQEESLGRGRTVAGVEPLQTGRLRQNAIRALGLAAIGQTLQGNISLAEASIARAIEAEFEPERTRLAMLERLYTFNRDALERVDKKRADNLRLVLDERRRVMANHEANRKEIYDIGLMARQFGADTSTVQSIFNAQTREEAVANAGAFLQDPAAQQQLANAKLTADLTKLKIAKEVEELQLLRKYGGLSPSEWLKLRQEESDADAKARDEADQAVIRSREITNDINQVNAILNSNAIDTVVGTNIFSRGIARQKGKPSTIFRTLISAPTGFLSGGLIDEFAGADDVVASIEQMTSTLFLDKLIAVKGQGATFGQLSDREGAALRNAAQSISQTAIRDNNDKVVGYDMSEQEFMKQIEIVKERLQFLYQKTTGDAFTPDEQAVFDALDEAQAGFNPAF